MRRLFQGSGDLFRVYSEPRPNWFLLWLPLLLIVFGGSPGPESAPLRLAGVLLLGMFAWGTGRGPAGVWAERGLGALLLVAWFAVVGTAVRQFGVPEPMVERLAMTLGLLLGPVLLLWAWHRRARLMPVVGEDGLGAPPALIGTLARVALVLSIALLTLDRLLGLQGADLLVSGTGLALYTTFRVQGRHRELGALG